MVFQRGQPEVERFRAVQLAGKEPFLWFVEADPVAEVGFAKLLIAAAVKDQAIAF
ncbi:hypothetical protein D3C83_203620 [compost metagenome]